MAATAVHARSPEPARRRRLLHVGDDRLVARVRAGDDAAFEIIYDRYYRGLLAFCGQMLGSRQEAEDALQHSFASAYRALRGGAGDIDLRPWLYTIARNRCLSSLRAQRAQVAVERIAPGSPEGMSAQVQLRADLRDLVEELQRLPDDQRAALVLFELGDESHEQIAAVLGVRREKVKALVFQAREALMRAREAREAPCGEIREQLATLSGRVPRRGMVRSHIDRCSGCAEFEREVRRQRAAMAAVLPLVPTVGLKSSVLGFAVTGGGAAALGGAGAGGGATVAAGGAFAAGGVGAGGTAGTAGAVAASAIGTAGAATVATGLATHGGGGLAALSTNAVVAKILAVVALGGGNAQAPVHGERPSRPAAIAHRPAAPAWPAPPAPAYAPGAVPPSGSAATVATQSSPPATPSAAAPAAPAADSPSPPPSSHVPAAPAPTAAPAPSSAPSGAAGATTDATSAAAPAAASSDAPAGPSPADGSAAPASAATSAAPAPAPASGAATPDAAPAAIAPSAAPASVAPADSSLTASAADPTAEPATAAASTAVVAAS